MQLFRRLTEGRAETLMTAGVQARSRNGCRPPPTGAARRPGGTNTLPRCKTHTKPARDNPDDGGRSGPIPERLPPAPHRGGAPPRWDKHTTPMQDTYQTSKRQSRKLQSSYPGPPCGSPGPCLGMREVPGLRTLAECFTRNDVFLSPSPGIDSPVLKQVAAGAAKIYKMTFC